MGNLAVVHYQPLEFYPPAINLLELLANENRNITVFTTHNNKGRAVFRNDKICIYRYASSGKEIALIRYLKYLHFNFQVLIRLLQIRPESVLYFETWSALPIYWYKRFVNRKANIFIHCHEYFPPDWYNSSSSFMRYNHRKEVKYLYQKAKWISHTNEDRIELFLKDHPHLDRSIFRVVPNYPPASWQNAFSAKSEYIGRPLKCVYIGSLSIHATYVKEFCEWIISQKGEVTFDIYSYNLSDDAKNFLEGCPGDCIRLFADGIEYNKIPELLRHYDVGILFYKATTPNFKFNAPNKLFEYLTCGLDVWFSKEMLGVYSYIREDAIPRVIKIDYSRLGEFDWKSVVIKRELPVKRPTYTSIEAFEKLIAEFCG